MEGEKRAEGGKPFQGSRSSKKRRRFTDLTGGREGPKKSLVAAGKKRGGEFGIRGGPLGKKCRGCMAKGQL